MRCRLFQLIIPWRGVSVCCHTPAPFKNGCMDQNSVRVKTVGAQRTCVRWDPDLPMVSGVVENFVHFAVRGDGFDVTITRLLWPLVVATRKFCCHVQTLPNSDCDRKILCCSKYLVRTVDVDIRPTLYCTWIVKNVMFLCLICRSSR